jgi:hypothetical protein
MGGPRIKADVDPPEPTPSPSTSGPQPKPTPDASERANADSLSEEAIGKFDEVGLGSGGGGQGAHFAGSSYIVPDDPLQAPIYMGPSGPSVGNSVPEKGNRRNGGAATVGTAIADFYDWTKAELDRWAAMLVSWGYITEDEADFHKLQELWEQAVLDSAGFKASGRNVTPFGAAHLAAPKNGGKAGAGSGDGKSTSNSFSSAVDLTNPTNARAILNAASQKALGRDVNDEEARAFAAALNSYEESHPKVSSSTYTTNTTGSGTDNVVTSQSSTSHGSGGADLTTSQELAKQNRMATPDYAEYQAASSVYNMFINALQSPVHP